MRWLSHIALAILLFTGLMVAMAYVKQELDTRFAETSPGYSSGLPNTERTSIAVLVQALTPTTTTTPSRTPTPTETSTPLPTLTPRPTYGPDASPGMYVVPAFTPTHVIPSTIEPLVFPDCATVTPAVYMNTVCEVKG